MSDRCRVNAQKSKGNWDLYVLEDLSTGARVEVHPHRGALVSRFDVGGQRVFYLDEATLYDESKNVRGGMPILFPIAGKLPDGKYRIGEKSYELKQHGFARNLPWRVVEKRGWEGGAELFCALSSSPETRAVFPFDFEATLRFSLFARTLVIAFTVKNTGSGPMPLHYGLHPYFFVPEAEKSKLKVLTSGTRAFDNRTGETGEFKGFDFTADELDLHLLDHRGHGTALVASDRQVRLQWSAEFKVLVVWTVRGKDYVCVEPWTAPGGALANRTGMLHLQPGEEKTLSFTVELR